jgi:hypothetical protein
MMPRSETPARDASAAGAHQLIEVLAARAIYLMLHIVASVASPTNETRHVISVPWPFGA